MVVMLGSAYISYIPSLQGGGSTLDIPGEVLQVGIPE